MVIKPDQIQSAVMDELNQYTAAIGRATAEKLPKVGTEAAKMIRKSAPRRKGKGGGEYAKTWTSKAEKGRLVTEVTVYAKAPGYKLAHLLEYGHANRDGGRTNGIEHIKPAETWANEEAEKVIVEAIEEAGR